MNTLEPKDNLNIAQDETNPGAMKRKVLVIDDEPGFTKFAKVTLESRNAYEVQEVNDSTQALEIAREFMPDVIFMDFVMPGLDGGFVHTQFKADPSLKHIPIIFVTAALTSEEVNANHGRMNGLLVISKPVNGETLIKCVKEQTGG